MVNTEPNQQASETTQVRKGPLDVQFPPDAIVWEESRRLVADRNVRVESLAVCASQDPVIAMELLKVSNAMYFSGGRAPITSTRTAIMRLGSELVTEALEKLNERPQFEDEDIWHWFELHRSRCKRTAIVARMLAEVIARNLTDDCHSAGLLLYVGEMLAVAHLGLQYTELAEDLSRSGIKYRLAQDLNFDVEKMGIKYLHSMGIPDALLFAIDHEGQARARERAIIKPVVWAAGELIDAFDSDRWSKFAPGKNLPAKSSLRLLQLSEAQYVKLYERASEYLFSSRLLEERRLQEALALETGPQETATTTPEEPKISEQDVLQSEIQDILRTASERKANKGVQEQVTPPEPAPVAKKDAPSSEEDEFSLENKPQESKQVPRKAKVKLIQPPTLRSSSGQKMIESVGDMLEKVNSSEEMLTNLLAMLVDNGPFEKAALIVVSKDRQHAIVTCSRGPIGNGQRLKLDDPLSPLAQCFSKVQSFGNRENESSPFGSKAFALAPIDADHQTPVALYADCGNDASLAFESRRIFRTVVDILNQRLPSLPGGIPNEL